MAIPLKLRPAITFRDVAFEGCSDAQGYLAFSDARLIAIIKAHGCVETGATKWLVEAGFGPCAAPEKPRFDSVEQAQVWVRRTCWKAVHMPWKQDHPGGLGAAV